MLWDQCLEILNNAVFELVSEVQWGQWNMHYGWEVGSCVVPPPSWDEFLATCSLTWEPNNPLPTLRQLPLSAWVTNGSFLHCPPAPARAWVHG